MATKTGVQAGQRFQRPALDEIGKPISGTFLSNVCLSHSITACWSNKLFFSWEVYGESKRLKRGKRVGDAYDS